VGKYYLKAKRIFDGRGGLSEGAGVLVENGRIASVGPGAPPPDAEIVDYQDATILPGLINAHVHIDTPPVPRTVEYITGVGVAELVIETARNLRQALASGVTYVRNMGSRDYIDLEMKSAVSRGLVPGPGILACGPMICVTGGHGSFIGLETNGADECRAHTRKVIKAGAGHIKFMSTGGILTPGSNANRVEFTYEETCAIVEEAHKAGRKTASHTSGSEGTLNALRAGTDSIEHGYGINDECIELMLKQGTFLVPTLSPSWFMVRYGREGGIPSYIMDNRDESHVEMQWESFRKAFKAGVRVAMGSDAGTPLNGHGESATEIRLMTEAGMAPKDALIAATSSGAELLGVQEQRGSIEAGKFADILVVYGDPLADIRALEAPAAVWKEGVLFRSELA
jgi:imidazolonepropionase-like amidohydrolase